MTEWILSSSILILIVIGLRTLFKGRISLRLQYAIWILVLLRLLIPVSFGSSKLSVANLTVSQTIPTVQTSIHTTPGNSTSQHHSTQVDWDKPITDDHASQGIDVEVHENAPEEPAVSLKDMAVLLWISGILSVAALFFAANMRFRRTLLDSRRNLEMEKNHLRVYASDAIDTPCLFGIRNPTIYVTESVAEDVRLLGHTLEHEATHHSHGDHIWAILRCACLAVHWYNPLVWWAAFLSQRDAELACDEATIKRLGEGERAEYGRTLIRMTCRKKARILITATTMNSGNSGLKERILLIAKKPRMALYTLLTVVIAGAIAVGCTFTGARQNRADAYEQLPEYLENYSYERVKDRMDREDVRFLGTAEDYALVYCSGTGPILNLYRYEIDGDRITVTDQAEGDYPMSCGLSVNHLVYGGKHIYFGLISDYHWIPEEDRRIPLHWKNLVFWDSEGNQKILNFMDEGYLCVLDSKLSDFWVVVNGGDVPLKMDAYLAQGYFIHESIWNLNLYTYQPSLPEETTPIETEPHPTEIPDDAPPVNIPEMLHAEPDPEKICIAVMPTMLSNSGEDYYYIIPEDQVQLKNYCQEALKKATKLSWDNTVPSLGWKILYQDQWWSVKEDGSILCDLYGDQAISSGDAAELFAFCSALVKEAGIGDPVRPQDIQGIISATLFWNGIQTITDSSLLKGSYTVTEPYILKRIEELFANSRDYGSVQCGMDARLELKLENGETKVVALATDSCASWMSEGCCYSYGQVTNVGIEGNEEFYSFFLTEIIHQKAQEGPAAMAEYWPYMHWGLYANKYGPEDTMALLYMFEDYLLANPTDWNIYVALTSGRGLDGAYGEFYAHLISQLFEAAPDTFRFACHQMIPQQYVEDAVNLLAFHWNITPEEVMDRIEEAGNQN